MAARSSKQNDEVSHDEELALVDYELREIEAKIASLEERKAFLQKEKEKLKDAALLKKSVSLASRNWDHADFPWSKDIEKARENVFKLSGFRPLQLQTMNAVLSKEDVILIMPTGGGKSLCYQLPAVISPGTTLVVSPLLSLMEDQLMSLKALNVNAAMLTGTSTKEEVASIQEAMVNKKSQLKLLYVTPEKVAKSKRFMTKLQKMYVMERLSLIAIDEVHCCSHWGHDFRPDYKFLGVLKGMFPDVPILGLTATATSKVTIDVQKMLNIQGCLVFKASFNRPNLHYEVRPKPSSQKECVDALVDLLKNRFSGKSGIIYSTSIKDCEDLMQELRSRNLRVGCYHATLDANLRSKVHAKWLSGEYQAVVATIAFGLGIDKPDVRFVIHHSLSKSMENFYQESGRAGRDNQPSDCILFYRFADIFRLSTMVFTQQTGLENLYGIVAYCLDKIRCRRMIIASHFDETWDNKDCNKMCDHCRNPREKKELDIKQYCSTLYEIMANAAAKDTKLTGQMLVDAWFGKGKPGLRLNKVSVPAFSRETGEAIVAHLLVEGYLQEDFHFTPYSTLSYIKRGPRASIVHSKECRILMVTAGKAVVAVLKQSSIKDIEALDKTDCSFGVNKDKLKDHNIATQQSNNKSSSNSTLKSNSSENGALPQNQVNNKKSFKRNKGVIYSSSDSEEETFRNMKKPVKRKANPGSSSIESVEILNV